MAAIMSSLVTLFFPRSFSIVLASLFKSRCYKELASVIIELAMEVSILRILPIEEKSPKPLGTSSNI